MPVQQCQSNGVSGWRWGSTGKCYTGKDARSQAARQGRAIEASKERVMTTQIDPTTLPEGSPLKDAYRQVEDATESKPSSGEPEATKDHSVVMVEPVWEFAGGAQTFDEYDEHIEASAIEGAVQTEMFIFEELVRNVMRDDDLSATQKAERVKELADDAGPRIEAAEAEAREEAKELEAAAADDPIAAKETDQPQDPGLFTAFRDTHDDLRWVAIHSNKYRDREEEIFSGKSHQDYADWVDRTKNFPGLRLWHIPVDIGTADMVAYDDAGFMVSTGTFAKEYEHIGEALEKSEKALGCSHGFQYRPQDLRDGVYDRYRSFEVSVLPLERSANLLTAFFAEGDVPMLRKDQREFLRDLGGETFATKIEGSVATLKEAADGAGVSYKEIVDRIVAEKDDDAAAPATEVVAPVAATPAPEAAAPEADASTPEATEPEAAPQEAADVLTDIVTKAVKAANGPLVERIDALEGKKETTDQAVADAIRPPGGAERAVTHSKEGAEIPPDVAHALKEAADAPGEGAKDHSYVSPYVAQLRN